MRPCGWFLLLCALGACGNDQKAQSSDGGGVAKSADVQVPDAAEAGPADDAVPDASSATLTTRARHLLEAIAKNSPDLATDMLFPRDGYAISHDDKDPAKAWDIKLKPTYEKAIARLSKRIKGIDRAVFVSFDLGHQIVRISPKKKAWKEPLWRVKHSMLSFTIDGKSQRIDIAELVAWRGNWYVTLLR